MNKYTLSFIALMLLFSRAHAEDVPQFRGSNGSGTSRETELPLKWSAQENVRWKTQLPGRGLSNPVIADGRVFLTACTGYKQTREHVLCFDLKDGKKLWDRQLWATGATLCERTTNMAAPTPVTDGKNVYALFATGDLACYDRDGNLLWYRSLVGDYPTVGNNLGMAASPVLSGETLIVCLENIGESFAAGIDVKTGQNRWRVDRPRGINWVTPLVLAREGKDEVILQAPGDLTAFDPATGAKKWSLTGQGFSSAPSPIASNGLVLTAGGKFLAVRPGTPDEEAKVVWQSTKLRSGYTSPVSYQNRVYTVAEGIVNCADATTGKALWTHRLESPADGTFWASPFAAAGRVYFVNEKGTTTVMEAGDEPKVLATNSIDDKILASPVASAGALFLRSDQFLYCIGEKK